MEECACFFLAMRPCWLSHLSNVAQPGSLKWQKVKSAARARRASRRRTSLLRQPHRVRARRSSRRQARPLQAKAQTPDIRRRMARRGHSHERKTLPQRLPRERRHFRAMLSYFASFASSATRPCVEESWPAALSLPSITGSRPVASSLPSSTPHWSNELMRNSTPSTKTRCS